MSALSDFAENKLIDWLFRGQALGITGGTAAAGTGPANLYVALLTAAPTDVGGGTEVTTVASAYARVTVPSAMVNWAGTQGASSTLASSGSSGTTSNNGPITFPAPTANWGVVSHAAIYDAPTGGNMLFWAALGASKTVNNADAAPFFVPGALTFQIDN